MKIKRSVWTVLSLILLISVGINGIYAQNTETPDRRYLIIPPVALVADTGGEIGNWGAWFAEELKNRLGTGAGIADAADEAYPADPLNRAEAEEYALITGADALVGGFYVVQERDAGTYFAQLVLHAADLTRREERFSLRYEGTVESAELPSLVETLSRRAAKELNARIAVPDTEGLLALEQAAEKVEAEKRIRQTVGVRVRSRADEGAVLYVQDGSSPGTLAEGELSFEVPADSIVRLSLRKEGHYSRDVERYAGTRDLDIKVPALYPVSTRDVGITLSYLRPFGLLTEGRLRLFSEALTLGASAGAFLLPEYRSDEVFAPDFSRFLIESETGLHLGWYLFSPPDALIRFQLELNLRINTYTNPYLDWRTFRAVMSGGGVRLEANLPEHLLYIGLRGYYPLMSPANVRESGIVLINGGVAWKY